MLFFLQRHAYGDRTVSDPALLVLSAGGQQPNV